MLVRRNFLAVVSLACAWWGSAGALADDICFPPATGIPGQPGPPDWTSAPPAGRPVIDDPRWSGSTRQSYPQLSPGGGSTLASEAQIRGVASGGKLYLSFQVLVDPSGTATGKQDSVYIAVAKPDGSAARLLRVVLKTPAAPGPGDTVASASQSGSDRALDEYTATSFGGAWSHTLPGATFENVAVWVTNHPPPASDGEWTVHMAVNLGAFAVAPNFDFKFWAGVVVQHATSAVSPTYVQYLLPLGAAGALGSSASGAPPIDPTPIVAADWANATTNPAAACSSGVSISASRIGVKSGAVLTNLVNTATANTFAAWPTYSGVSSAAGKVKANFRLANWGSVADPAAAWDLIVATDAPSDASGNIEVACDWDATTATPDCPSLGAKPPHQCMLVTLRSDDAVRFIHDSAWRNMDFGTNSLFERSAEINLLGLKARPGEPPQRNVYLYVKTRNLPAKIDKPLEQRSLAAALVEADYAEGPARQRASAGLPPPSSLSGGEIISQVWPTYEVHVFYDTGDSASIGGLQMRRLASMLPFGYYLNHSGQLSGWQHAIQGVQTKLEELAPNYYRLQIVQEGKATVLTSIEGLEPGIPPRLGGQNCPAPQPLPPRGMCACEALGAEHQARSSGWLAIAAASLLLAFAAWRRRLRSRS